MKMTETRKTTQTTTNKEVSAGLAGITETTEMTKTAGIQGASHGSPKQWVYQKPGDHPNFRKNALGVKRPFSELSESSGVFSEQLSELEIPFSEYEIPFSEWPLAT